MTATANDHARKERAIVMRGAFQLAVAVEDIVAGKELVLLFEITDNILWQIRAQHLRHATLRPLTVNVDMASAACLRNDVTGLFGYRGLSLGRGWRRKALRLFLEVADKLVKTLCRWFGCLIDGRQLFP